MDNFTTVNGVVDQITRIHRFLPPRPDIDDIEAAKNLIKNVDREETQRLEAISKLPKGREIPEEIFFVYIEMQRSLVYFQSNEQKRDALKLLDLENAHQVFDELIQRASQCVSPNSESGVQESSAGGSGFGLKSRDLDSLGGSTSFYSSQKKGVNGELFTRDDSYVNKTKTNFQAGGFRSSVSPQIVDFTLNPANTSGGEKMSLIKLASLIEVSAKKGTRELNLQNKLSDQVEWLPDSVGKLLSLVTLDLSENRIVALPTTIGSLLSLASLDLHSNRLTDLPDPIGDLLNLVFLDLRANYLTKLPPSIGQLIKLEELDLSSNQLSSLPDNICTMASLKKLNIETNNIEELPHTIGQCTSLTELRVDYNRLKALPEAVGKIESLEILSVRYNNIRQLPTTMSSLTKLRELDVSFNELESVPESLCFATSLVKMNISNNFADLRSLPRSIGNLERLEELDISNNQIRMLPESFRLLTRLCVLRVDQNPLELPPRQIAEKGAQDAVQYMEDYVKNKDMKAQPVKHKKSWAKSSFFRGRTGESAMA